MTGAQAITETTLGFEHVLERGGGSTTLLLLHSTGGDEHQLVALGRELVPTATLLSPRARDPYVPPDKHEQLVSVLTASGAEVTDAITPGGHGLSQRDLEHAARWLAARDRTRTQ